MSVVAMVWIDVRDGRGGVAVSTFFSCCNVNQFEAISLFQVGGGERLLGTLAEYTHQNNQNSI